MNITQKIGFIGAGHMTAAIVSGLVQHMPASNILVSNRSTEKLQALASNTGITAAPDNEQVISQCDVVVLSVKPQLLEAVLLPLQALLKANKPMVISVAAGIRCASILAWVGAPLPLVRAMPNTPATIGEGVTGLFSAQSLLADQSALAAQIFSAVGLVTWVEKEHDLDLVTALSGSGPAYFMLFIQSMIDAAVARGMNASTAKTLALQTARGTAGMIAGSDKSLTQMIDDMLLPGGTTEQAVAKLRQLSVPSAIDSAVGAAHDRAAQLADELDG